MHESFQHVKAKVFKLYLQYTQSETNFKGNIINMVFKR